MRPSRSLRWKRPLRALSFGLCVGLFAAALRAPRGLDLIQVAAVAPEVAGTVRGAALCAIGLALLLARRALPAPVSTVMLPLGAALGFALGGLVLDPWLEPSGPLHLVLTGVVGTVLLLAAGGPGLEPDPALPPAERPTWLDTSGIACAGFGAAFGFEGLARWVRLFGLGRPADDAVSGTVFLLLVAFGALCFRDLVRGLGRRLGRTETRVPLAAGATLAAAATIPAIWFLALIASRPALEGYARSFGLSLADHGGLAFDALIAARACALPGLLLGAALTAAQHRVELARLVLGAALGTATFPRFWSLFVERSLSDASVATTAACTGACVAAGGAFLTSLGRHGRPTRVRVTALVPAAIAIALAACVPRPAQLPHSPWGKFEPQPLLARQDPSGYVCVEPARGFSTVLTLDRERMTALSEESTGEELQLELSLGLLDPEPVPPRVLLVGQLTPSRWWAFRRSGIESLDRTAPWWRSMEAAEEELFGANGRPPGEIVAPEELHERLVRGQYELVVAPPTGGLAPLVPDVEVHADTVVVIWLDAAQAAAQRDWGEAVLWAGDGLLDTCVASVSGPWSPARRAAREAPPGRFDARTAPLALWPVGAPTRRSSGLKVLTTHEFLARRDSTVAAAQRLVTGARTERERHLAEALVALHAAQRKSSWQTRHGDLELDFERLAELRDATLELDRPDAALAAIWEGLATTLVEQREIQAIQDLLGPLATKYACWPALELALARSDLEFNDPGDAARRLVALTEFEPHDIDLRLRAALALGQAGEHEAAAAQLRVADALQPERRDIRRELAMAMVRAEEAGGRSLIRELIEEDPEDVELEPFLGAGPFPPPPAAFEFGARSDDPEHASH